MMLKNVKILRSFVLCTVLAIVTAIALPVMASAEEVDPTKEEDIQLFTTMMIGEENLPECEPPIMVDPIEGETGSEPVVEGGESTESFNPDASATTDSTDLPPTDELVEEPTDSTEGGEKIDGPAVECVNYAYDGVPTSVECEEGQDPCIQPYYRTTMVEDNLNKTLAMNEEDSDSANTESTTEELAAQSGIAENATDVEATAFMVTAMPKTGNGGDTVNYPLLLSLVLVGLTTAVVIYRKKQQQ
jgi:hypothetical protein